GLLPQPFFDFWGRYGFSTFNNGACQLINPLEFAPSLRLWLKGTDYEDKDQYFAYAMSFDGSLRVWGATTGKDLSIHVMQDAIMAKGKNQAKAIANGEADKWAVAALYMMQSDLKGIEAKFFDAATAAHGPLAPGEMFGLVPALPLGGQMAVENLQKVSAPEYLAMVGELNEKPVLTTRDLARRAFGAGADASIDKLI
ncbi:MAG: GAD-like domain-containing protein, partial [Pseudomonadota bacterium]